MIKKICFYYFLIALMVTLGSCSGSKGGKVSANYLSPGNNFESTISGLSLSGDTLSLNGGKLDKVKYIKIKVGSSTRDLLVSSQAESSLQAKISQEIIMAAGEVFSIIIGNAHGEATFGAIFNISDGTITTQKIADGAITLNKLGGVLSGQGVSNGQILKWNGASWVASTLNNAQTYIGTYNANTDAPALSSTGTNPGDYLLVQVAGTQGGVTYNEGDMIIFNGLTWDRVAGLTGPQGIQGLTGLTGSQGLQGIQGIQGDLGPQGIQGIKGDKGDVGDAGPQGIQGLTGLTGSQGLQGIQGIQGPIGLTGLQGIQGIQGDTGLQGIQGLPGTTPDDIRATLLSGLSDTLNTNLQETDSVIVAFGKIQEQIKVDRTTLSSKANSSDLSNYVTTSSLSTSLSTKADASDLSSYATSSSVTTSLSSKADSASLSNYLAIADIESTFPGKTIGSITLPLTALLPLTQVATPVSLNDVVNVSYFNDALTPLLNDKADLTDASQTITALKVTGLTNPSSGTDAVNKDYTDGLLGALTTGTSSFSTGVTNGVLIGEAGAVPTGTTSKLKVYGAINTPTVSGAGASALDFKKSNTFECSGSCTQTAIGLQNLADGSSYTYVESDTANTKTISSFTATKIEDGAALTVATPNPILAARANGKRAMFNFMRIGSIVYITWMEF